MIENLPNIEETLAYKQLVAIGEKRGEKRGERATLIRQIQLIESMNQNGELDDNTFGILSKTFKNDLKKVTTDINEMIKRQEKERKKKLNL